MTIESVTYIDDLDNNYPESDDPKSEGDDHIRNIKTAIKSTFPNVTGAVTPTHTELNYVDGVTSSIQTQINTAMANGVASRFPNVNATVNATDEELNFVDGVTSNIQTQFSGKLSTSGGTVSGNLAVNGTLAVGNTATVEKVNMQGYTLTQVGGLLHRAQKITPSDPATTSYMIDLSEGNIIFLYIGGIGCPGTLTIGFSPGDDYETDWDELCSEYAGGGGCPAIDFLLVIEHTGYASSTTVNWNSGSNVTWPVGDSTIPDWINSFSTQLSTTKTRTAWIRGVLLGQSNYDQSVIITNYNYEFGNAI